MHCQERVLLDVAGGVRIVVEVSVAIRNLVLHDGDETALERDTVHQFKLDVLGLEHGFLVIVAIARHVEHGGVSVLDGQRLDDPDLVPPNRPVATMNVHVAFADIVNRVVEPLEGSNVQFPGLSTQLSREFDAGVIPSKVGLWPGDVVEPRLL